MRAMGMADSISWDLVPGAKESEALNGPGYSCRTQRPVVMTIMNHVVFVMNREQATRRISLPVTPDRSIWVPRR